jgi:ribosome-associated toxin RatA of RatAB toxin-antitoxin module
MPPEPARNRPRLRGCLAAVQGLLLPLLPATALAATEVGVSAVARDDAVEVATHALVRAPLELVWQTLTDYDHLARFVPGIEESHVVSRQGNETIIEQTGGARFFILSYPIRVTLRSNEHPYESIEVHLVRGNLRRLSGTYHVKAGTDGNTVLTWNGLVEPAQPLPAFMRVALLRHNIADQFAGMVREIERRASAAAAPVAASESVPASQ